MLCDHHTYPTLPARDIERARRFYEDVLGFEPASVSPAGVIYDARGSRIFVYASQFAGTNEATACGFAIDDLPALVAELKSRGVRFEEYDMSTGRTVDSIMHTPDGAAAWFKDTEGNIIGLFQSVSPLTWPRDEIASTIPA
jgi:catechol 2,3-dioxygenase-like lactoylglutathione lyase family enzyme